MQLLEIFGIIVESYTEVFEGGRKNEKDNVGHYGCWFG